MEQHESKFWVLWKLFHLWPQSGNTAILAEHAVASATIQKRSSKAKTVRNQVEASLCSGEDSARYKILELIHLLSPFPNNRSSIKIIVFSEILRNCVKREENSASCFYKFSWKSLDRRPRIWPSGQTTQCKTPWMDASSSPRHQDHLHQDPILPN